MVLQVSKEQLQSPCQSRTFNKSCFFSVLESLNFHDPCNMQGIGMLDGFYALIAKIKRSQLSAAPTGDMFQMNFYLGSLRAILGKMLSTLF